MKGILFKPEIWQAKLRVLEEYGEAVTRRVIKPQLVSHGDGWWSHQVGKVTTSFQEGEQTPEMIALAPYQVGETVYIKEAWATELRYNNLRPSEIPHSAKIFYANDGVGEWPINLAIGMMRSTLHLPEVFARYFIEMKDVRAERLQEISEEDAWLEGFPLYTKAEHKSDYLEFARECFGEYWDSLNKDYPWESNPWVFKYEFERNI